jgi:hypothetical protein
MGLNLKLLPSSTDRSRVGGWIFVVAYLAGNSAFMLGLDHEGATLFAVCTFAIACALWWMAYRMSLTGKGLSKAFGFLVAVFWLLNLIVHPFFEFYVPGSFFWISAGLLLCLILATVMSEVHARKLQLPTPDNAVTDIESAQKPSG